ncbi:hypothetical protein BUE80_DR000062 [Diplocarpon rosae]|nr:hypothetical protein BUE80_DR000062 [Diplocarpon rosae]
MTTLQARGPYTQEELQKLYPKDLELQLVQVLLRHGERSPVSARFQNAGINGFWPYCSVARQMMAATWESTERKWEPMQWRRRLETFGKDDGPSIASGPKGEVDAVCNLGELTDKGRETTWELGRRLRHLYVDQLQAFAQRTADRWNNTDEMQYLNKLLSKWMPENSKRVAVDSHPRLSGIMDTVNSTLAHGPATRLPKEFYDSKGRKLIEKIGVEEWFSGYQESAEYRQLGIGALMGDVVERMVGSVEKNGNDGHLEIGGKDGFLGDGRGGEKSIKFALSGCHDTTLAAVLSSLGAFDGEPWPPYTSHIALELFKKFEGPQPRDAMKDNSKHERPSGGQSSWISSFFGGNAASKITTGISRQNIETLSVPERSKLDGYFVRLRYNDKVMSVPGCKPRGKHLDGDDSFCTLDAFKSIVDKYTPKDWKLACLSNMDASAFPKNSEPAGY